MITTCIEDTKMSIAHDIEKDVTDSVETGAWMVCADYRNDGGVEYFIFADGSVLTIHNGKICAFESVAAASALLK